MKLFTFIISSIECFSEINHYETNKSKPVIVTGTIVLIINLGCSYYKECNYR